MKKIWESIKNFLNKLFGKKKKKENENIQTSEPILDLVDLDAYEEIEAPIFVLNDKGKYKVNTDVWTVKKAGPSSWDKHAGLSPIYNEEDGTIRFICKCVDTNEDGWSTAAIKTKNAYSDGYFECYAKFNSGKATWPAIWTSHPNGSKDNYASYYEVDLSEYYNTNSYTDTTYHCPESMRRENTSCYLNRKTDIKKDDWNKFGCSWDEKEINVYINDKIIMKIENDGNYEHFPQVPEHRTFNIILSMQYTSKWLPEPILDELPLWMDIKDFKLYKRKEEI